MEAGSIVKPPGASGNGTLMNCGSFSVMGVLAGGCTSCVNDQLLGMKVSVMSPRSEEHTSELQSHSDLVCRLLLEKKKRLAHLALPPEQHAQVQSSSTWPT